MLNIRSDISREPNPPVTGDCCRRPASGELLVWTGTGWLMANESYDNASRTYFKKQFDKERDDAHNQHPTLKAAWEEYTTIKKLIGR